MVRKYCEEISRILWPGRGIESVASAARTCLAKMGRIRDRFVRFECCTIPCAEPEAAHRKLALVSSLRWYFAFHFTLDESRNRNQNHVALPASMDAINNLCADSETKNVSVGQSSNK